MLFKRPHVVATFGFGGRLFVSMPRKRTVYSPFGAAPSAEVVDEGVLNMLTLKNVLKGTPFLNSFTRFPGPLKPNASKVRSSSFMQVVCCVGLTITVPLV